MKKTDRKIAELVEALRGKNSSQTLLIGKVAGTNPFALKLYDLTVTKHIYVNQSFVKTSNAEIDGSIIWNSSQDYVPSVSYTHLDVYKRQILQKLYRKEKLDRILQSHSNKTGGNRE